MAYRRFGFWNRLFLAFVLSFVVLGLSSAIANVWVLYAGRPVHKANSRQIPNKTVAIVLGAKIFDNNRLSATLRDRLEIARRLYTAKKVKKILLTGGHRTHSNNEVRAMYLWLRKQGIPQKVLYTDHAGFRTLDSMARAVKVFEVEDALIVTQRFHLRRSVFLAKQMGINAEGVIADRRRYSGRMKNQMREFIARFKAVLDIYVLGTQPRYLGKKIPISGPARDSYDKSIPL